LSKNNGTVSDKRLSTFEETQAKLQAALAELESKDNNLQESMQQKL